MDILFSYLIGAVPTGYLFGRLLKGIDIRQYGSGNIGATNVWRVLGKKIGIVTLIIDILKGLAAVTLIAHFFSATPLICGLAAILGHNFPIYLKFRGGKGVATSVGVVLGLAPNVLGTAIFVWTGVLFLTKYVSLASMIAGLSLPLLSILFGYPPSMHWFSLVLGILVIIQHRANIKRFLKGEEKRFFRKIKK